MLCFNNHVVARTIVRSSLRIVYVLIVICICIHSLDNPRLNWDLIPYIGSSKSIENHDVNYIHESTYRELKDVLSPARYIALTQKSDYQKICAENAESFNQQLPYYKNKPLFVLLIFLLNKLGFSSVSSTYIPSVIFYGLISLLIYTWIRKYQGDLVAFVASLLIILSPLLLKYSSASIPDLMSAFVVLLSIYFLYTYKYTASIFLLLLSIFVRVDNVLLVIIMLLGLFITPLYRNPLYKNSILLLGSLATSIYFYYVIVYSSGMYPWKTFFYHHYANHGYFSRDGINFPRTFFPEFSLIDYSQILVDSITELFKTVPIYITILAIVVVTRSGKQTMKKNAISNNYYLKRLILLTLGINMLLRFFIIPDISFRFSIVHYIVPIIFLIIDTKTTNQIKKFIKTHK